MSGPHLPGRKNDLQIFRDNLKQKLMDTELIVADATYSDLKCIYNSGLPNGVASILRSRQESIFSVLKTLKYAEALFGMVRKSTVLAFMLLLLLQNRRLIMAKDFY